MAQYRKKPVVVDAFLFTGGPDQEEDPIWLVEALKEGKVKVTATGIVIQTLEGVMSARLGDYVIRGVQGEIYPCKPDIFEATYEAV